MEVILLERVARLGQMGDVVRVKDGFARNFLLPRGKALRATDGEPYALRSHEERTRKRARSTLKSEAAQVAAKLDGKSFTVLRQASEAGQLFGSVSPRDLVGLLAPAASTSAAIRSRSTRRSRRSAGTTCRSRCIRRSRRRSRSSSPATPTKRRASNAARTSRGCAKSGRPEEEAAVLAAEAFFEPEAAEVAARPRRRGAAKRPRALPRKPTRASRRAYRSIGNIVARARLAGFAAGASRRHWRGCGRRDSRCRRLLSGRSRRAASGVASDGASSNRCRFWRRVRSCRAYCACRRRCCPAVGRRPGERSEFIIDPPEAGSSPGFAVWLGGFRSSGLGVSSEPMSQRTASGQAG